MGDDEFARLAEALNGCTQLLGLRHRHPGIADTDEEALHAVIAAGLVQRQHEIHYGQGAGAQRQRPVRARILKRGAQIGCQHHLARQPVAMGQPYQDHDQNEDQNGQHELGQAIGGPDHDAPGPMQKTDHGYPLNGPRRGRRGLYMGCLLKNANRVP